MAETGLVLIAVEGLKKKQRSDLIQKVAEYTRDIAYFGTMGEILLFAPVRRFSFDESRAQFFFSYLVEAGFDVKVLYVPSMPGLSLFRILKR